MAAEDDSDIPENGAVFTFGKSKFADNLPNKFWVRNDQVGDVACGDEHTALVAESGRVFTFGTNDWGQLGLGSSKTADRPSCIKSLKSEKVKLVACGRSHTVVATESGKIFSFGNNGEGQLGVEDSPASNVPKCIDSLVTQQYKQLAAGTDHSVALTEEGAVYVWGGGSEGQLGLGGRTECLDPEELMIEDVVTCISCGYYHTALVTESGGLYTFGESEGGKLGLGDDPDETDTPQRVEIPEDITAVACGGSHTVALTASGNVYTFGDGPSGQLGHGTHCLQISTPKKLNIKFKVSAIACGENHTALVSDKGQLYTCGDGRHGKLALGQESFSNVFVPQRVKRFSKFTVEKVSCGGCHMICLAKLRPGNSPVSDSEEETIGDSTKINGLLNHSLRPDNSIDLNNSVTARDRRRKNHDSFKNDLNRTLPALAGAEKLTSEHLHQTVPAVKSRKLESTQISKQIGAGDVGSMEKEVIEESIKAVTNQHESSSPRAMPRPPPRKQSDPVKETKKEEESSEEEEDEEMNETSTMEVHKAPALPARALPKLKHESESEEEDEEEEEGDKDKKQARKQPPIPPQRKQKPESKGVGIFGRKKTGISDDEEDDDDEEEVEDESKENDDEKVTKETVQSLQATDKKPKNKEETKENLEEDEEEEKEKDEEKDKKLKDKKKDKDKKAGKDKGKDKKKDKVKEDTKDKKKGKNKKDEKEEGDEEEEEEEMMKKKLKKAYEGKEKADKKDKKTDKKDKKGKDKKEDKKKDTKKDKKKGKKDDENEEEDEENEEVDVEAAKSKKDNKDKKSKKEDKKKDDSNKDKKDEDSKEGDNKEDKENEKKEEKKEDEKPAEPPKKKSRTCTIL
ncbi:X-linked retinitis pigmentosa GTPase regulator-like [Dreissena polymorpha]|uniref:X-linked retinitis pigmentosa GTPase regulator-like n=1 Tax=Dreissena polymorpha TaxID=45954 RepID=UPI0022652179|nr:X-linked retinitis pigmentosa GTPase regulator-like [Dreissena polymorpha]